MDTLDRSRLTLDASPDGRTFDGAWWPHGHTLSDELPRLFAAWPVGAGDISRVYVSSPDWDEVPATVAVPHRRGRVKVGTLPAGTMRQLVLIMVGGQRHLLAVVPPEASAQVASRSLGAFAVRRQPAGPAGPAGPAPSVDA